MDLVARKKRRAQQHDASRKASGSSISDTLNTVSRLALEFADLSVAIANASPADRVSAAVAAATAAVERTGIQQDPVIVEALQALSNGEPCAPEVRDRVEKLVGRLDEAYWSAQDALEPGQPTTVGTLSEFARARAANAVWFALAAENTSEAQDVVYEAHYGLDDPDRLRSIVRQQLG